MRIPTAAKISNAQVMFCDGLVGCEEVLGEGVGVGSWLSDFCRLFLFFLLMVRHFTRHGKVNQGSFRIVPKKEK